MPSEKAELIGLFAKELEDLTGKCYQASNSNEVGTIVSKIVAQNDCASVVKQKLNIAGEEQIRAELGRHGVHVTELEECVKPVEMLKTADLAITRADLCIARTGTLVMATNRDEDRLASCLPRIHVAVASAKDIVLGPLDATEYLKANVQSETPRTITFVSGPSRTADIEMRLILGVHGPHQVHVIILKS